MVHQPKILKFLKYGYDSNTWPGEHHNFGDGVCGCLTTHSCRKIVGFEVLTHPHIRGIYQNQISPKKGKLFTAQPGLYLQLSSKTKHPHVPNKSTKSWKNVAKPSKFPQKKNNKNDPSPPRRAFRRGIVGSRVSWSSRLLNTSSDARWRTQDPGPAGTFGKVPGVLGP